MPTVHIQGQAIEYRLRQSGRAKRVSIRFTPQYGFEIVYPLGKTKTDALAFFKEEDAWVLKTWAKAQARAFNIKRENLYVDGAELLYLGKSLRIRLRAKGEAAHCSISATELEITLPLRLHADQSRLRDIVIETYRGEAKRYLPIRTRELARLHGFSFNQVRIKNQKTRWGSCSAKRNINLNMRLMMAPHEAIDYVIIHELCHLRELNHTRAFWALVERHCPDFRRWKAWFKEHGPGLIL